MIVRLTDRISLPTSLSLLFVICLCYPSFSHAVIDSLRALDFDDTYIGTLSAFLTAYRMRRKAIKEGTAGVHPMDDDDEELDEEDDE